MVLLLSAVVFSILIRSLKRDIIRYNDIEIEEHNDEEYGWKIVHGDVFRPPIHRLFLSIFIGNGLQMFFMSVVTITMAALGFLSPTNRGSLITVMLVCYVLFGGISGYVSARIYKLCGGQSWRRNVLLNCSMIPGYSIINTEYYILTHFF